MLDLLNKIEEEASATGTEVWTAAAEETWSEVRERLRAVLEAQKIVAGKPEQKDEGEE